jgi:hypothetical protein
MSMVQGGPGGSLDSRVEECLGALERKAFHFALMSDLGLIYVCPDARL